MSKKDFHVRFWEKVERTSADKCWNWTGAKNSQGYGEFWTGSMFGGKHTRAHQVSWIIEFGEIPVGMCVCHKCDNPSCVNPAHLFLGTVQDNNKDCRLKGRAHSRYLYGVDHPQHGINHRDNKLSEQDVILILKQKGKKTYQQIADDFGVSSGLISNIFNGRKWKWLTNL